MEVLSTQDRFGTELCPDVFWEQTMDKDYSILNVKPIAVLGVMKYFALTKNYFQILRDVTSFYFLCSMCEHIT